MYFAGGGAAPRARAIPSPAALGALRRAPSRSLDSWGGVPPALPPGAGGAGGGGGGGGGAPPGEGGGGLGLRLPPPARVPTPPPPGPPPAPPAPRLVCGRPVGTAILGDRHPRCKVKQGRFMPRHTNP